MKSTTGSQLAEQAYQDYIRESQPSDKKQSAAFMFNIYADRVGIPAPFRITSKSPDKFVKVCAVALKSVGHQLKATQFRSINWIVTQVVSAWDINGIPQFS